MTRRCPECFVAEGEMHQRGCLAEECSACGQQRNGPTGCGHRRKRIPFLWFPPVCVRCGVVNPVEFVVPNKEWRRYVPPSVMGDVLCLQCYREIKEIIDGAPAR